MGRDNNRLIDRYRGERILLTGVTGFLAKAVLEKLLRSVPGVERIYLLVRPRGGADARERIEWEVLRSPIFERLRSELGTAFHSTVWSKLVPVSGDLSTEDLGIEPEIRDRLTRDITLVINCGATCSFREQLDRALQTNTLGPRRVLQLAIDSGNVPLVHISTAYVYETLGGELAEEIIPPGHSLATIRSGESAQFDLDGEIADMLARCEALRTAAIKADPEDYEWTDGVSPPVTQEEIERWRQNGANDAAVEYGIAAAKEHGWRDAYQFTKSLGELLINRDRGEVPVSVVRPSIIDGTFEEPVPGWLDGIRMYQPIAVEYGRGNVQEFAGYPDSVLDLIPCDMVANLTLAAVADRDSGPQFEIYQIASSMQNPLTLGMISEWVHKTYRKIGDPFPNSRFIDRKFHWEDPEQFQKKIEKYRRRLELLRDLYSWIGLKRKSRRSAAKLRVLNRMAEFADIYGFYIRHRPAFRTDNTTALLESMSDGDRETFGFDISVVNWEDYFVNRWIPGLQRVVAARAASPGTGSSEAQIDAKRRGEDKREDGQRRDRISA